MIISLIGFMGTGKSTVGKVLARKLSFSFLDTDKLIEQKEGKEIQKIFQTAGEAYFRQVEKKVLLEILAQHRDIVLATGGGIVLDPLNRVLLQEKTYPVLLEASPQEIIARVSGTQRPLLGNKPEDKVKDLLVKRKRYYQEFSQKVSTDGRAPEEIAESIIKLLGVELDARNKSQD